MTFYFSVLSLSGITVKKKKKWAGREYPSWLSEMLLFIFCECLRLSLGQVSELG